MSGGNGRTGGFKVGQRTVVDLSAAVTCTCLGVT